MPDRDILRYGVGLPWTAPFELIMGGRASPEEVAQRCKKPLTRDLDEGGGALGLDTILGLLRRTTVGDLSRPDALESLRSIERQHDGSRNSMVLANAARALVDAITSGASLQGNIAQFVAERFCRELVINRFFGPLRPVLLGARFASSHDAATFEAQCLDALHPAIANLASQLLNRQRSERLYTPRVRIAPRASLAELLQVALT